VASAGHENANFINIYICVVVAIVFINVMKSTLLLDIMNINGRYCSFFPEAADFWLCK